MDEDVIEIDNQFYIRATSSRLDGRTRVLKRGETFALCDRFGDIASVGLPELGLYHEGTRFLSRLALTLEGQRPLLLSSGLKDQNGSFVAHLTNADVYRDGHLAIPRGTIHLVRESWTFPGGFSQALSVRNYGMVHRAYILTETGTISADTVRELLPTNVGDECETKKVIDPPRKGDSSRKKAAAAGRSGSTARRASRPGERARPRH